MSLWILFYKKYCPPIFIFIFFWRDSFIPHSPPLSRRQALGIYTVSFLPWRRSLLIHLWQPHILSWFALPDHLLNLWGIPFSLLSRRQPDWQCRMKWWLGWKTTIFLQLFWSIELWASALILWWYIIRVRVLDRGEEGRLRIQH